MKALIALICILAIPPLLLALIGCLLFVLLRWFWRTMSSDASPMRKALVAGVTLAVLASPYVPYLMAAKAYRDLDHRVTMERLPKGIVPLAITYRNEETWGMLGMMPGDKEIGLIAYSIAPIADEGVFRRVENGTPWHETPVGGQGDRDRWRGSGEAAQPESDPMFRIRSYLGKYGFGIDIPDALAVEIDQLLNAPGSHYRFSRGGGVVIVDPVRRRAYYAYAG